MTDQQAPERVWLPYVCISSRIPAGYYVDTEKPVNHAAEYVHSDLLEAAEKRIKELEAERDELAAENKRFATVCHTLTRAAKNARAERDQALAKCEVWRKNSVDTWAAMRAMRHQINEYIPMPSLESDLLQGPENSIFCATIAEAVVNGIQAQAVAAAIDMRERAADTCFNPRWKAKTSSDWGHARTAGHIRALPLSPDQRQALNAALAKAWDEGQHAGWLDRHRDDWEDPTPNPYRKGEEDV